MIGRGKPNKSQYAGLILYSWMVQEQKGGQQEKSNNIALTLYTALSRYLLLHHTSCHLLLLMPPPRLSTCCTEYWLYRLLVTMRRIVNAHVLLFMYVCESKGLGHAGYGNVGFVKINIRLVPSPLLSDNWISLLRTYHLVVRLTHIRAPSMSTRTTQWERWCMRSQY